MPRSRIVKPEFWDDEKLATISRDARLTYIGLWTYSDDHGVVKGHPGWLKNKIYPYEEIRPTEFQKWMIELEKLLCILPFESDGEKFYYIRTFTTHQTINRPSAQRYPEPPSNLLEYSRSTHGVLTDETETETETETELKQKENIPARTKFLDSVFLSDEEYRKLQEAMGQKSLDIGIEKLDYSITVKGGKYKDHYKTLLNWHRRGYCAEGGNKADAYDW